MTSNLRKIHKLIWFALAIVVPIILVVAVLGISTSTLTDDDLSKQRIELEESILDNDQLFIGLNEQETPHSLKIILKKPLSSPTPVAYAIFSNSDKISSLGPLDKKGIYTFPVDRSVKSVRIYDELKKVELLTVDLPWD